MLAIVMPVYNRSKEFEEALKSLTVQTKKRFITIVVDDASEEDLFSVVKRYDSQLHIVYLRQEKNLGPGAARKRGLQWCFDHDIELVMFLDGDDLLLPKAVERLTKEINITNSDIVVSELQSERKDGIPFLVGDTETVWTHGKIYRVSFLKRYDINFIELKTNEDLAFNTVAFFAAKAFGKVARLEEEHYLWQYNKNSITRNEKKIHTIAQLSKDAIKGNKYCIDKFKELGLDVITLFPRIISLYTHLQILKTINELDSDCEEIIKWIYNDKDILPLFKGEFKKHKRLFTEQKQGTEMCGKYFLFSQTFKDFVFQYTGIEMEDIW